GLRPRAPAVFRPGGCGRGPAVDRDAFRAALSEIVGDARASARDVDRRAYARDMWPRVLLAVREGAVAEHPPDVVVWPQTAEEVAAIVRLARARRVPGGPPRARAGPFGGA